MKSIRRLALLALPSVVALVACQGAGKSSGTPITGVLTSAQGQHAPLTLGQTNVGDGFAVAAVLGSAAVTGSGIWRCYAPDPPTFQNYDLEGTDNQTYGLFISVVPSAWTVGPHAIDGVNVTLLVAAPDRFGTTTNGTLVITTAGQAIDTLGSTCAFYTTGAIPLFGTKN